MRIAISGTANTGKTTLLKNFINNWPQYTTLDKTYRDIIKDQNLSHSSDTTVETQWAILNFMIDQLQSLDKKSKIVLDRCPLDNLAYTLWAYEKEVEGFDKPYVDKCITLVKESMRHLDVILLLKHDDAIPIVDDGVRDTDITFIKEVDNIFTALFAQYEQNYESDIFFPANDSPGIIVLPTSIQQRIDLITQYIDGEGDLLGEEHSIFNPEKIDMLEQLVKQQQSAHDAEIQEKELYKKFGLTQ